MGLLRFRLTPSPPRRPRVSEIEPPTCSVSLARARQREARFLERFLRGAQQLGTVTLPTGRRAVRRWTAPLRDERLLALRDLLKALRRHDHELLEQLPAGGGARIQSRDLLKWGRRPALTVSALTWSPWEELACHGRASKRAGVDELETLVAEARSSAGGFHVIGVLSTTGWDRQAWSAPLGDSSCATVLVDPLPSGGWRLRESLPASLRSLLSLFEPESREEREQRCLGLLLADRELSIPGGHRDVDELIGELGVDEAVLRRSVARAAERDVPLTWVTLGGRELIKRDRLISPA